MTSSPEVRDFAGVEEPVAGETRRGNMYVAVVGIDRYRTWNPLRRAVSDARGARDAFVELGFQEFRPALFEQASGLRALGSGGDDFLSRWMWSCRPSGRDSSSAADREK
jgi:hypothetical protein